MALTPAFARLLADRRQVFNGRVAAARSRTPAFDAAAFNGFLRDLIDPLLAGVLSERPDGGVAFVDAAFDMAVALVEHGWAGEGARIPHVNRLWRDVAPRFVRVIATNARESLGALSNAAVKLSREPGVRIGQWLDILAQLGASAGTARDLRHLATMAAWRAGAAHVRTAALRAAAELPGPLACAVVGVPGAGEWGPIGARLLQQRWWAPDRTAPSEGHRVGAFTGLGGGFAAPPTVVAQDGELLAVSADGCFLLLADAFGATLLPAGQPPPVPAGPDAAAMRRLEQQSIRTDDRIVRLDWPANGLRVVETGDSIAVTSAYSHAIRILPRVLP